MIQFNKKKPKWKTSSIILFYLYVYFFYEKKTKKLPHKIENINFFVNE